MKSERVQYDWFVVWNILIRGFAWTIVLFAIPTTNETAIIPKIVIIEFQSLYNMLYWQSQYGLNLKLIKRRKI